MPPLPSAEQLFAGLPDALLLIDPDQRMMKVNPAAEALLGMSAKHIIEQPITRLIEFEDDRLERALRDSSANLSARAKKITIRGQSIASVDFDILTLPSDSSWRIVSLSMRPSASPADDEAEAARDPLAMRAPDILGHEIKNPLAAIKGAAQLLERSLTEEQKELSGMIKAEVERIAKLIDRVQSLSTNQPAALEPTNIHSLIDRARQSIEAAHDGRVEIGDRFDPSLPEVLVDSEVMMQVLTNLLQNAVDATEGQAKQEITVVTRYSFGASFAASSKEQAVRLPVEIIVQDNGPGVDPEIESAIFSPFVSTKADGQGLGLSLVRKLMGDMNGQVRYERDRAVELSRFILFLPVARQGAI